MSATDLRWLYEEYRTTATPKMHVVKRKPGEWLPIGPRTPQAGFVGEAARMDTSSAAGLEAALKSLAGHSLNRLLNVEHEQEVRITHFRNGTGKTLYIRFFLAPAGSKSSGVKTVRADLPASVSVQTELLLENPETANPTGDPGVRRLDITGEKENQPDGRLGSSSHVSDGQPAETVPPIIDLSALVDIEQFQRFLVDGGADEDTEVGRFVKEAIEESRRVVLQEDTLDPLDVVRALSERFGGVEEQAPIYDDTIPDPQNWENASSEIQNTTLDIVAKYRTQKGKLAILCPSPSGGKTHAMVLAARSEQAAGRRVGYAVLAKGKLMAEAKERLTGGDKDLVRLHIIEGRHEGNCQEYDSVKSAAALGYHPGTQVCPKCDLYPSISNPIASLGRNATCEYYASRLRAISDYKSAQLYNNPAVKPFPLILTTHAAMAIGTAMDLRGQKTFKTQPSLWQFDTIFIDEDPTGALEQQFEIKEEQLVYEWIDPTTRRPDAHTMMTRVLRAMFTLARAQREIAWSGGFKDHVHSRDNGSTYASNDLVTLMTQAAKSLGYDLHAVLAQVENESEIKKPGRGELLDLKPEKAAKRYPHRHLAAISKALYTEIETRTHAPEKGAGLDLVYRVHANLDLRPDSDIATAGTTDGLLRLKILTPFAAPEANVIIGDAYASIEHYEELFRRFRRHGSVDVVNNRVKWPRSSVLIRVPTRCTSGEFHNEESYIQHCETAILPLLGLEHGRKVLLYTHKTSREALDDWMRTKSIEHDLEEYAIEHWGSGRGKDIYRGFDTFIAVTEFLPNIYGLVHEANGRMAQVNALTPRIYFWNAGAKREDGASLTDAITSSHAALASVFQRRAIDELAQAVHRIRPAMPSGRQKRCWVLGFHVPLSAELLAATSATLVQDQWVKRADGRGARINVSSELGLLGFVSARELATAMAEVYRSVGCWSPIFAHTLMGVPVSDCLSRILYQATRDEEAEAAGEPFIDLPYAGSDSCSGSGRSGSWSDSGPGRLVDRVYTPPRAWRSISDRVVTLPMYRAAKQMFVAALCESGRPMLDGRVRRPWLGGPHHPGVECIGNPQRLEHLIEYYSTEPPVPPF